MIKKIPGCDQSSWDQIELVEQIKEKEQALVVYLKNVQFYYKKNEKLIEKLDINVRLGQIYGLLGPTGCGKTTTLKLILGMMPSINGELLVFGKKPNTPDCPVPGVGVGYMPQNLCLLPNLKVFDIFRYYGRLNGMNEKEIKEKSIYLLKLLEIPSGNKEVQKLSGGQQRRTSLAIALFHSPPLLILDEPTVGLDPLLRVKIWNYLQELTKRESKTIIITTHYIEESRNADMIGLMRNGKLLVEDEPKKLLLKHQAKSIEEVFLYFCELEDVAKKQVGANEKMIDLNKNQNDSEEIKLEFHYYNKSIRTNYWFDVNRVKALFFDVFCLLNQNFLNILVAILLPTTQIFLFHYSIGRPLTSVPIIIHNPDTQIYDSRFSDVLINSLNPIVHVSEAENFSEAIQAINNGEVYATFRFHSNFTKCMMNRIRKGIHSTNNDIACSTIKMMTDNTDQFVILQLALFMKTAFETAIEKFFPKYGYNPQTLNIPIKIEKNIYGKEEFSYQEFMTPGMYMALIYLAPMVIAMFIMLEQKVNGHMERSQACGVKKTEFLMAHFMFNVIILSVQCSMMMITSLVFFDVNNEGSLVLLVAIVLAQGLAGVSMSLLMGGAINDKLVAMVFIYGLTVSLWLVCGIFWPIQNMNFLWTQKIVQYLPLTLSTETARNIMNRGWGILHPSIISGFVSTFIYFCIPIILAVIFFDSSSGIRS